MYNYLLLIVLLQLDNNKQKRIVLERGETCCYGG